MERVHIILAQFKELGEKYKSETQVLKHINMYITICENSIETDTPLSSLNKERFVKIIETIKNQEKEEI